MRQRNLFLNGSELPLRSLGLFSHFQALRMSGQAKQESDTGEIVNHMSLDAQRVAQLVK